jgi:hypothetical protein
MAGKERYVMADPTDALLARLEDIDREVQHSLDTLGPKFCLSKQRAHNRRVADKLREFARFVTDIAGDYEVMGKEE